LERFKRHPIFGNGYFRASEKDKVIGRDIYFYPLDIGLYGILYSLGALGILIFIIQLRLVWTYYTKRSSHPFHFFVVLALLFFTFSSILNGNTINNFKAFFFFVCLLAISNSITAQPIVHVKRRNKKDIVKAEKSGSIV
jgi:hypothetical protein